MSTYLDNSQGKHECSKKASVPGGTKVTGTFPSGNPQIEPRPGPSNQLSGREEVGTGGQRVTDANNKTKEAAEARGSIVGQLEGPRSSKNGYQNHKSSKPLDHREELKQLSFIVPKERSINVVKTPHARSRRPENGFPLPQGNSTFNNKENKPTGRAAEIVELADDVFEETSETQAAEESIRVRVAQQALKQAQKEYEVALNQTLKRRRNNTRNHSVPAGILPEKPPGVKERDQLPEGKYWAHPENQAGRRLPVAVTGQEPPLTKTLPTKSRGSSVPTTRFKPHNQEESDEFYLDLPVPWNVVPDDHSGSFKSLVNLQKSSLVPTFDGKPDHYNYFRDSFVMAVHYAKAGVFAKDMLLRQALKGLRAYAKVT